MAAYAGAIAGLKPESRLLLFGTDNLDYVTLWLGAVRLGAAPVVISDLYKAKDLAYFLADAAVRLLFIDIEQVPKLLDIAGQPPPSLTTILVRGDVSADLATQFPGCTVMPPHSALSASGPSITPHKRHANDLTYMFYSGGTTGTAKGITANSPVTGCSTKGSGSRRSTAKSE
jgi:benzoate-CoA ligase